MLLLPGNGRGTGTGIGRTPGPEFGSGLVSVGGVLSIGLSVSISGPGAISAPSAMIPADDSGSADKVSLFFGTSMPFSSADSAAISSSSDSGPLPGDTVPFDG